VDWLDKTKSMLMGIVFEKLPEAVASDHASMLHATWGDIYRILGTRNIPGYEILQFVATFLHPAEPSKVLGKEEAYDFIKHYCLKQPESVLDVASRLKKVTEHLVKFDGDRSQMAVTRIAHTRFLAIAILETDALKQHEREIIMKDWERISFKIFGLYGKDARTGVGTWVRLAYRIHNKSLTTIQGITDEMKKISTEYPIALAIAELQNADCYNNKLGATNLRYLFLRYEEWLCRERGMKKFTDPIWEQIWKAAATDSIEHIRPENKEAPGWQGKMGRGKNQFEKNVHRIGNLVLLPPGMNSSIGQKSFNDKKEAYKTFGLQMLQEIIKCPDWNKETINQREQLLLKWVGKTWFD
jgi:hypothetical protein